MCITPYGYTFEGQGATYSPRGWQLHPILRNNMPVKKVIRKGRVGYRWGERGKIYFGKGARGKAARQGRAIKARGNK
jgi:hypothetical protein